MTSLQQNAHDYLALRQGLGHKMAHAARELPRFVAYLDAKHLPTVTTAAAWAWAQSTLHQPASGAQRQRLSIARGFARFMVGVDPTTEIPPTDLLVHHRERRTPFIYSRHDIQVLMSTVRQICPESYQALLHATVIGLLAVTGLRVGEALRLADAHVDWARGLLVIFATKFGKSRAVVLDASTITALARYVEARRQHAMASKTGHFFVTEQGNALAYAQVGRLFRKAVQTSGVGATAPTPPHLHDLRYPNLNKIPTFFGDRGDDRP